MDGISTCPGINNPLSDRKPWIRDNQIFVKIHLTTQPSAVRAGTIGAVEGEYPGAQLGDADTTLDTGVPFTEEHIFSLAEIYPDKPIGKASGNLKGISQAFPNPFLDNKPVHDNINVIKNRGNVPLFPLFLNW